MQSLKVLVDEVNAIERASHLSRNSPNMLLGRGFSASAPQSSAAGQSVRLAEP